MADGAAPDEDLSQTVVPTGTGTAGRVPSPNGAGPGPIANGEAPALELSLTEVPGSVPLATDYERPVGLSGTKDGTPLAATASLESQPPELGMSFSTQSAPRRDRSSRIIGSASGCELTEQGAKNFHISFVDEIDEGAPIAEVKEVESYKEFNSMDYYDEGKSCTCILL